MGSPPFRRSEGKKLPPVKRANRPPLLAALKDISFLLPAYHSFQQNATKTVPGVTSTGNGIRAEDFEQVLSALSF